MKKKNLRFGDISATASNSSVADAFLRLGVNGFSAFAQGISGIECNCCGICSFCPESVSTDVSQKEGIEKNDKK